MSIANNAFGQSTEGAFLSNEGRNARRVGDGFTPPPGTQGAYQCTANLPEFKLIFGGGNELEGAANILITGIWAGPDNPESTLDPIFPAHFTGAGMDFVIPWSGNDFMPVITHTRPLIHPFGGGLWAAQGADGVWQFNKRHIPPTDWTVADQINLRVFGVVGAVSSSGTIDYIGPAPPFT